MSDQYSHGHTGSLGPIVTYAAGAPVGALPTPLYCDTATGDLYLDDNAGGSKLVSGAGGGGSTTVGATAPASPAAGDLWKDTSFSPPCLKCYDGAAWLVVNDHVVSATAPTNPHEGQIWYDTNPVFTGGVGELHIYAGGLWRAISHTDPAWWVSTGGVISLPNGVLTNLPGATAGTNYPAAVSSLAPWTVTIPAGLGGLYHYGAHGLGPVYGNTPNRSSIRVDVNGTSYLLDGESEVGGSATHVYGASRISVLSPGNTITFQAIQTNGVAAAVNMGATTRYIYKVG